VLAPGFLQFLPRYWTHDPNLRYGLDWEHLWFVAYVLVYALLVAPLQRVRTPSLLGNRWFVVFAPVLLTALLFCTLRGWFPITNNLVRDWSNHVVYLPYFLLGFVAVHSPQFWLQVERLRWPALAAVLATYLVLLWGSTQYDMDLVLRTAMRFVRCVNIWAALLVVLGFARRWLNHPNATIAWLNRGVFCFYIIHQPIIAVVGFAIAPLRLGVVGEPVLLIAAAAAGSLATYVAADRLGPAKILLGLPRDSARRQGLTQQQLAEQG
jgi:hypothetical protein